MVLKGRTTLSPYHVTAQIGAVIICGALVLPCLSTSLDASQNTPEQARDRPSTQEQDAAALRLAAEQGDAEAQNGLGNAYANGAGVPENTSEAVRWFRLAADQGYAVAQANLGLAYTYGVGVLPDPAQAVRWFRLAADQAEAAAQYNLGSRMPGVRAFRWMRARPFSGFASLPTRGTLAPVTTSGSPMPTAWASPRR